MSNFRQLSLGAPYPICPTNNAFTSYTFANTTDQVEFIFQVPDPGDGTRTVTITKLGYRLASVTGTSPVMKISLQGVDASGNPDGVIKGGGSPASQTFTPAGTATWNWVTLANSFAANAGDFLAIVIAYSSGTLSGAATPTITMIYPQVTQHLPYAIQNVAGARTRQAGYACFGFSSASKAFGFPVQTLSVTGVVNPAERALRFILDQSFVGSYKVAGVRFTAVLAAANKITNVVLYQGTTALQTVAWDSDAAEATGVQRAAAVWFQDSALATLVGGQEYRIAMSPTDAANNIGMQTIDVATASDLDAFPGGQTWYLSTRATQGATAWTDVLTSRPAMELIISDWTSPLGFLSNRGMTGGLPG